MTSPGSSRTTPTCQDRYLPAVLKNGVIDGKTYALPNNNVQPVVLYFNKDVFAKVGAEAPKTWDELMALVPKFKAAGIAPFSLGGQSRWPDLMWLEYLVDRIGGPEVFANIAANKPNAWSDPAVTEALTKIQQLVDAGGFVNGFSSIAADSNADQALLYTGKAAMMLQGGWIYQSMKKDAADFVKSGKLGYTTFPTVSGGKGDPANVVGNPSNFWSISSQGHRRPEEGRPRVREGRHVLGQQHPGPHRLRRRAGGQGHRKQARRVPGQGLPDLRVWHGQERPEFHALLGPGPQPGAG